MAKFRRRRNKKGFSFKKIIFSLFLPTGVVLLGFAAYSHFQKTELISPLASLPFLHQESSLVTKNLDSILKKYHISYKSLSIDKGVGNLTLENGGKVLFSLTKPFESQISSLQAVLTSFTIEGKRFAQIDLRYDRPVLTSK